MNWKPWLFLSLLIAAYIYLATAVFGTSHPPRGTKPRNTGASFVPPRLFLNGEVARVRATGRKVVVLSAEWDRRNRCYVYTVRPI